MPVTVTSTKRWSRRTKGRDVQVYVAKAINYTVQTNYQNFIANAVLGEFGIFDATTSQALISSGVIAQTQQFFLAQQLTNGIKRTQLFTFSEITPRKVLYTAPTLFTSFLGWNYAGGNFNNPDVAAVGNNYEFALIQINEGNEPYDVQNFNYTMKPQDVSDAVSPNLSVACALAKIINNYGILQTSPGIAAAMYRQSLPLAQADVVVNATLGNFTLGGTTPTMAFTQGSALVVLGGTAPVFNGAVGNYLAVPNDMVSSPTTANVDVYRIIAVSAGVSITLDRPFKEATTTMTQAQAQGTLLKTVTAVQNVGLKFTAINAGEVWRMAQRDELLYADNTAGTFINGSGTAIQVQQLELEGSTFQGDSAKNTAFAANFGLQDYFVLLTDTYDYYFLDYSRTFPTLDDPQQSGSHKGGIVICCPKSAGNTLSQLTTIFGV